MTTSYWARQHTLRTPDASADVVIIGAGYVGLSTAYWLTEFAPELKISVIDRQHVGSGASGRNAGFLTMGSASFYKNLAQHWGVERARAIKGFAEDSLELVSLHVLKSCPEIKFERAASMTLFKDQALIEKWNQDSFSAADFGFSWKTESDLPEHFKGRFAGAFEAGPEYKVNPMQLLLSLRKLLEGRKVQFIDTSAAFELLPEGVRTESSVIRARQAVLAMNAYLGQFHPAFKSAVIPRRAQMLAVELEDDIHCPHLYYDPPERVYWRKTQEKVLIIGGKRLLDEQNETGDFEKLSPVIQAALEDYLRRDLGLKYKVINRWSGTMGFTEHELPVMGKIQAPLETYVVGGFSGHGMGLGFRSGKDLAEEITTGKPTFFSTFKKADFQL